MLDEALPRSAKGKLRLIRQKNVHVEAAHQAEENLLGHRIERLVVDSIGSPHKCLPLFLRNKPPSRGEP